MMKMVSIVAQRVYANNGIFDATHDDPHIPGGVMRRTEKGVPIKAGG